MAWTSAGVARDRVALVGHADERPLGREAARGEQLRHGRGALRHVDDDRAVEGVEPALQQRDGRRRVAGHERAELGRRAARAREQVAVPRRVEQRDRCGARGEVGQDRAAVGAERRPVEVAHALGEVVRGRRRRRGAARAAPALQSRDGAVPHAAVDLRAGGRRVEHRQQAGVGQRGRRALDEARREPAAAVRAVHEHHAHPAERRRVGEGEGRGHDALPVPDREGAPDPQHEPPVGRVLVPAGLRREGQRVVEVGLAEGVERRAVAISRSHPASRSPSASPASASRARASRPARR